MAWVERDSIRTSLDERKVAFRVQAGKTFDGEAVRTALSDAGYGQAEIVTRPEK